MINSKNISNNPALYPHQIEDELIVGMGYIVDDSKWGPIDRRVSPIERVHKRFKRCYKFWRMCRYAGFTPISVVTSFGGVHKENFGSFHKWLYMPTTSNYLYMFAVETACKKLRKYIMENDMSAKKIKRRAYAARQKRFLIAIDLLGRIAEANKICERHYLPMEMVRERLVIDGTIMMGSKRKAEYYAMALTSKDTPENIELITHEIKDVCRMYNVMCDVIDALIRAKVRGGHFVPTKEKIMKKNVHAEVLAKAGVVLTDGEILPENFDDENPFL
jgi:hypothetical protein